MSLRWFGGISIAAFLLCLPLFAIAQSDVEAEVRSYFADIPVMASIAKCESEFTQFGGGGASLHGGAGGGMVGVFQINENIHDAYARNLGMDIDTLEGNLAYARYLYEREGTVPWNSSSNCWKDIPLAESTPIVFAKVNPLGDAPVVVNEIIPFFTHTLSIGMEDEDVRTLQRFMNGAGFPVAGSGPGSVGNETTRFGSLTRTAVQKFQCAKGIVCDSDAVSTGYGIFGPRTRAALLETPQNLALTLPINFNATSSPPYAEGQQAEVLRLQAQIVELQKMLADLLAQRGS